MVENLTEDDMTVKLNTLIAKQYIDNLNELKSTYGLDGDVDIKLIASMPDVMKAIPEVDDEEEVIKAMVEAASAAAESLDAMRAVEGEELQGGSADAR